MPQQNRLSDRGSGATTGGRHRGEMPQPRSAIIEAEEVAVMKSRQGYKGYIIVARSCELREGEFSAEFSVEEHAVDGWKLSSTCPTHSPRRSPQWRLRFRLDDRRSTRGLREDQWRELGSPSAIKHSRLLPKGSLGATFRSCDFAHF